MSYSSLSGHVTEYWDRDILVIVRDFAHMKTKYEFKIKHAVEPEVFVTAPAPFTHGIHCSLGSEHTSPTPAITHTMPATPQFRLESTVCSACRVQRTKLSALIETWCFNYRKQWHLIFPYCCSSACKHYISMSLVYIVFKCLILKLATWACHGGL